MKIPQHLVDDIYLNYYTRIDFGGAPRYRWRVVWTGGDTTPQEEVTTAQDGSQCATAKSAEVRTFQAGDRVKIARKVTEYISGDEWLSTMDKTVGSEGVVKSVDSDVRVEFADGYGWWYPAAALEHVDVQSTEVLPRIVEWFELKPGDLALDVGAWEKMWTDWHLIHGDKSARLRWRGFDGEVMDKEFTFADGRCQPYASKAVLLGRDVPKNKKKICELRDEMQAKALEIGRNIPRT